MTQPSATPKTPRPPRTTQRPAPGETVRLRSGTEKGVVVESDDWWDTLQLRGIQASAQVLIEWPENGNPVRRWALVSDLAQVREAAE